MRRLSRAQVSTGDEGFTASSAQGSWMEDGSKGLDAAGNLACAAIDFATVHLCTHPCAVLLSECRQCFACVKHEHICVRLLLRFVTAGGC